MFENLFHADWSKHEKKRWCAVANKKDGCWNIVAPKPVESSAKFLDEMLASGDAYETLAGFDFPIGVPAAFGERSKLKSFRESLSEFGNGQWAEFFEVANNCSEISIFRPFYPYKPGGTKMSHLIEALGLSSRDELFRMCEGKSAMRAAASSLFWTLGAKQVGKAAISGWKEIVIPAIQRGATLWPFDGSLEELSVQGRLVFAETYPAEAYHHIGIKFSNGGKRNIEARKAQSRCIQEWTTKLMFALIATAQIL